MASKNMKAFLLFLCFILVCWGEYQLADNPASQNIFRSDYRDGPIIGPIPRNITIGTKTLDFQECGMKFHYSDRMLDEIIDIYNDVTFGKGYKLRCKGKEKQQLHIHIDFKRLSPDYVPNGFNVDFEKYTLKVDEQNNVNITADYYPGIVRALDTLSQLIEQTTDKNNKKYDIKYVPIDIIDWPEYPYRGLMIDTAREYFFPDVLKMTLDGMMLGRNNGFHWHFSEDDSIPMFSKSYPDLVNYTAFTDREIYTPDDVKEIVRYAKIRAIRVIPEIEGPSHMHITGFYPEFEGMVGCFVNYTSTDKYHGGPPYSPMNPADERTYEFLGKYLKDLSEAFDSDYWHLGGDEVSIGCVKNLAPTKEFLEKNNIELKQLQQYYTTKERDILTNIKSEAKAGYWYRDGKIKFKKGDILQAWGGGNAKSILKRYNENFVIYSSASTYYLDCGYMNQYGGNSWCGGIHNWKIIWDVDPRELHEPDQKERFLGGELPLWSEMNNEFNLPLKLFPRGGSMSFRLWNPEEPELFVKVPEMLVKHQYRVKQYGVPTSRITQRYCEQHLHH